MHWAAVGAWMGAIFTFSTDAFSAAHTTPVIAPLLSALFPHLAQEHVLGIATAARKLGHVGEYFILGALLMRAFPRAHGAAGARGRIHRSIVIAILYAISDEWHQSFVPSRSTSAADVSIDAEGAICGVLWLHWREWRASVKRNRNPRERKP